MKIRNLSSTPYMIKGASKGQKAVHLLPGTELVLTDPAAIEGATRAFKCEPSHFVVSGASKAEKDEAPKAEAPKVAPKAEEPKGKDKR